MEGLVYFQLNLAHFHIVFINHPWMIENYLVYVHLSL